MIGFPEERDACEWAVGMRFLYVCVYVHASVCVLQSVHMFVSEVVVCMPRQEVGATTEQCLCNVSDE